MKKIFKWIGIVLGCLVLAAGGFVAWTFINMPPTWGTEPAWSPDGQYVAFASDRIDPKGDYELFILDVASGDVTRVTTHDPGDHYPSWSPDGSQLVYASEEDGDWYICTIRVDGTNRRCLVPTNTFNPTKPAWSPDGDAILFPADANGQVDIFSMHPDGTALINLTQNDTRDSEPSWSPDGSEIVFTSDRSGSRDLYIMNRDGSNVRSLTTQPKRESMPHWLPDTTQSKIAYISNENGRNKVFIIDPITQEQRQLTDTDGSERHFYPAWSPDGRQLAFMRVVMSSDPTAVYVVDVEGPQNLRLLTPVL